MSQSQSMSAQDEDPIFVSLGLFLLDELRFPSRDTLYDVPGGSGIYATLGARLLKSRLHSTAIGCIVLAGQGFPPAVLDMLRNWDMGLQICEMPERPTTRGLLVYEDEDFGQKSFTYVTSPLQPQASHLEHSKLLRSKSYHLLAAPEELESQVMALTHLREKHGIADTPLIVWEPRPPECKTDNFAAHLHVCHHVNVFSPNHLEIGYLIDGKEVIEEQFSRSAIERRARKFIESGVGRNGEGLVVVRCGEHGALTMSRSQTLWVPSFYERSSPKVVDPTGAGNAFLGGFTIALQESGDPREASLCGSVTASFALEQLGLPRLTVTSETSRELWNGADARARLEEFRARLLQE